MIGLLAACGSSEGGHALPDSSEAAAAMEHAAARRLLAQAEMLRDSAKAVLATLLADPSTATFDSLVVIQPPMVDGRQPALVACGRVGGRPGIGGRRGMTRFVYQGRWTVFVEEEANREQFAELWARGCDPAKGSVIAD